MTARARINKRLPDGYQLATEAVGGTGNGDERFQPVLRRWEARTTGHLWWKRRTHDWYVVHRFEPRATEKFIIETAHRIEAVRGFPDVIIPE